MTWSFFSAPAAGGTLGYPDAVSWWWIGPGVRSKTADGGLTWTPTRSSAVTDPLPGSLVVLDSKHAWVGAVGEAGPVLFTTADGGDQWTEVRLPPIAPALTP